MNERTIEILIRATSQNAKAFTDMENKINALDKSTRKATGSSDDLGASGNRLQDIFSDTRALRGFTAHLATLGGGMDTTSRSALYLLSRLSSAQTMLTALGSVAVVGGVLVLTSSIVKSADEIRNLELQAIRLHQSFKDFSEARYGMAINRGITDDIEHLSAVLDDTKNKTAGLLLNMRALVAESASKGMDWLSKWSQTGAGAMITPMPLKALLTAGQAMKNATVSTLPSSKEGISDYSEIQNRIFDLQYEGYEKRTKLIDEEVAYFKKKYQEYPKVIDAVNRYEVLARQNVSREKTEIETKATIDILKAQGQLVEAEKMSWELRKIDALKYSEEQYEIVSKLADISIKNFERARYGIKAEWEIIEDISKQSIARIEDVMTDVFVDGLNNKFQSAGEIARSFFIDLERMAIKAMMSYAIQSIFGAVMGGVSGIPAGATEIGHAGQAGWAYTLPQRAGGGYIPETGAYMLHRGEQVTKASDVAGNGSTVNHNYYIYAVDSQSFAQAVQRNPDAIESVVNQSLRYNKGTRSAIKSMGR